uniref:2'-5' oligoadenylate synthase n=1 Tax=Suricata suricatta TaxID=37032 RepID=A0A673VGP9_SURSU
RAWNLLQIRVSLSDTPSGQLDKFIESYLLPDTRFRRQVRRAIHIISSFLKERCFQDASHPVRVSKVVKGGSSGKGTTLRGRSDADLVVFLSNLTSFQDQLENRAEFIWEIKKQLEACREEEVFDVQFEVRGLRWAKPRALSFVLRSPQLQEGVEFDVLPAFDVLGELSRVMIPPEHNCTSGEGPDPQIYINLIQECQDLEREGEFSTCFTELQRDFLKQRPTKVKSLIRLVKHWYQLVCSFHLGKSPRQGFCLLEAGVLLCQEGLRPPRHSPSASPVPGSLFLSRPVILDPADPTGNVAGEDPSRWQRLAEEASIWLSYPCFTKWDGSPVGSWNAGGPPGRGSFSRQAPMMM